MKGARSSSLLLSLILVGLLLVSSPAAAQCGGNVDVTGVVNGVLTIPAGATSCTWTISFKDFPDNGDPFPLIGQFVPKSTGASFDFGTFGVSGILTKGSSFYSLASFSGSSSSPSTSLFDGSTYATDIGGDNTYGKVLRFYALQFRVTYTSTSSSNAGFYFLYKISDAVSGYDLDRDGFLYPSEDCCDTQRQCTRPKYVNIGAFNIAGNGINDAGSGAQCTSFSDVDENYQCSTTACTQGCTAQNLLMAMNLCSFVTQNSKKWGVLSQSLTKADLTGAPCAFQTAIMTEFTGRKAGSGGALTYNTASYYKPGETFAVLSTGSATNGLSSDTPGDGGCSDGSRVPAAYTDAHSGYLYVNADGCGRQSTSDNWVYDSVSLNAKIRVPTNANSFSFLIKFVSREYPEWVCTAYNDFFLTLLFRSSDPNSYTPYDHNVAFYPTPNRNIPLSINLDDFFLVCQSGLASNANPQRTVGLQCQPSLKPQLDLTGFQNEAGTINLRNSIPVYPGEIIDLSFLIFDTADQAFDSFVILDEFTWSSSVVQKASLAIETACPISGKVTPGVCGCDVPDVDTDGDGTLDCKETCPNDPLKLAPGVCGCGVPDIFFAGSTAPCKSSGSNRCCVSAGHLGGAVDWTSAATGATTFSFDSFLERNGWCYVPLQSAYFRCTEAAAFGTPGQNPAKEDLVPALEFNSGTQCGAACTGGTTLTVTSAQATRSGTWTAGTNFHSATYTSGTTSSATYTFTVAAAGVYFLSVDDLGLSSSTVTSVLQLQLTQGATTIATLRYKPAGLEDVRVLGSFTLSASSATTVVLTASSQSAASSTMLATTVRLTSYNPGCDVATSSFATKDEAVYVPAGQSLIYEASSTPSCNANIYAADEVLPVASSSSPTNALVDEVAGNARVRVSAPTTGGRTFFFRTTASTASCSVTVKKYVVANMRVAEVYPQDNLLVAKAQYVHYYRPGCPAAWTASYEGVARSKLAQKSYRLASAVPTSLSPASPSPQFALPSLYVRQKGDTAPLSFGINRLPGGTSDVRFGQVAEFSARFFSEDGLDLTATSPAGSSVAGSLSSKNLNVALPSNLPLGYHPLTLVASNTATGASASFDVLVRVIGVPANARPTLSIASSLKVSCPSWVTVTVTDSDPVTLTWRPEFPFSPSLTNSLTGSPKTMRFDFVPTSAETFYVFFTASDSNENGFGYGLLSATPSQKLCPDCGAYGTCQCDDTCLCEQRWTGPTCSSYTNTAPSISTALIAGNEDTVITGNLQASDPNGDAFVFELVASSVPSSLTVTVSSSGAYTVTPRADYFNYKGSTQVEAVAIKVTVRETATANLLSSTKDIEVRINNVQDAPTLTSFTATVDEDCLQFPGTVSAQDKDNDTLTFTFGTASLGTLARTTTTQTLSGTTVTSTAAFTYVCGLNLNGVDSISLSVSDGTTSVSSPIVITVRAVNDAPVASPKAVTTAEDTPIVFNLEGSDVEGQVTFSIFQNPTKGTLTSLGGASFRYTPAQDYNGPDSFTFRTTEVGQSGLQSQPATVTITVTPVNDPPVLGANTFTILEDTALNAQLAATDVDDTNLQFALKENASGASVSISATGALTVTPPANYFGTITFTFTVRDSAVTVTGTATVTVTPVNDRPTFTIDPVVSVEEDSGPYSRQLLQNLNLGSGETSDSVLSITLTYADQSKKDLFSQLPSVTNAGVLTFTFKPDVFGSADLSIVVRDNGGTANGGSDTSASASFRIEATSVNDPPFFTVVNVTGREDTAISQAFVTGLGKGPRTAGVTNEDSQSLTFTVTSSTCGSLLQAGSISLSSSGIITATPIANAFGSCSLAFSCKDTGGGSDTTNGTLAITLVPVNDPPTFTFSQTSFTYAEDAGSIEVAFASNISPGAANEVSDQLAFVLSPASGGSLFSSPVAISAADGKLRFTPAQNEFGQFSFSVTLKETNTAELLSSSSVTVTITITPVNDPPSFSPAVSTLSYNEDQAPLSKSINFATSLSRGPANEASQTLSFVMTHTCPSVLFSTAPSVSIDTSGGLLTFTLGANRYLDSACKFTLTLVDSGDGTNQSPPHEITLMVVSVNDAPTFLPGPLTIVQNENLSGATSYSQPWASSISPGPYETDSGLQFLVVQSSTSNSGLFTQAPAISSTGTLSFTVAQSQSGIVEFTVSLKDSQGTANGGADTSSPVTLRISVQPADFVISSTVPAKHTVAEDVGAVAVSNFVSGLQAPTAEYTGQFEVSTQVVSGASLFSSAPQITLNAVSGGTRTANLAFTPGADKFGSAVVSVTFTVPGRASQTKTFTIEITPVNDAPSFLMTPSVTRDEDVGAVTVAALATSISAGPEGEAELDGQTVSFTVTCTNSGIFQVVPSLVISGSTADLQFTAAANQNGVSVCTVVLTDSKSLSATRTLTITLNAVNDAPSFSVPPTYQALEDAGAVTVSDFATSISKGPSNEDYQTLTFALVASDTSLFSVQPALSPTTGVLTFTPAANLFGSTSVAVTLTDSEGATATATFTITILSVNDAPSFTLGASSLTDLEDAGKISVPNFATGLSAGPSNEASQGLSWEFAVTNENLFVKDGSGKIFSIDSAGTLTYTIKEDVSGTATITVTLRDTGGTANGGVDSVSRTVAYTLTFVNDPPSFTAGSDVTLLEDAVATTFPAWATNLNKGDPLESTQTLTFTLASTNAGLLSALSLSATTGDLLVTPAANQFGSATINATLCDNLGACVSKTFGVAVSPVNDLPTFAVAIPSFQLVEDDGVVTIPSVITSISVGPANEVSDVASFTVEVVSATVRGSPAQASAVLSAAAPPMAAINPSTGALTLARLADGFGTVTLSVRMSDGTDLSASAAQIIVEILAKNDAPSFTLPSSTVTVKEDEGPFSLVLATSISKGPANEDYQALSFAVSGVSNPAAFAPGAAPAVSAAGALTFNTVANFNGQVNFTLVLSDNGGTDNGGVGSTSPVTVSLVVSPVNDLPVAQNDAATTPEDTPITLSVLSNDSDVDGDVLTVKTITSAPAHGTVTIVNGGQAVLYTPAANYFGPDSFRYVATDSACQLCLSNEATVTITVSPVNDAPVAQARSVTLNEDSFYQDSYLVFMPATDVEGDSLTHQVTVQPTHGTLTLQPGPKTARYTPSPNYCGPDSFSFKVNDGKVDSNVAVVSLTVTCVPDAPVTSDIYITMEENTNVRNENRAFQVVATDADGDNNLRFACTKGPAFGNIQISLNTLYAVSGTTVYFTPTPWKNGNDTLRCYVQDSTGLTANFTVYITVTGPSNHPPVIDTPYLKVEALEDISGTGSVFGKDWDGTPVTYLILSGPTPASLCTVTFSTQSPGTFAYVPLLNQNGLCSFTWAVTDGQLQSLTSGLVEINIAPVNDAPVAQDVFMTALEEQPTKGVAVASDVDIATNADVLYYLAITAPKNGTLSWPTSTSPEFTYQGNLNFFGVDSFTYLVADLANTKSELKTVTITVSNVNDAPTAQGFSYQTQEDTALAIDLGALVADVDNTLGQLSFAIKTGLAPKKGAVTPLGTGIGGGLTSAVLYTPSLNANGADSFTYVVSDGQYSAEAVISISIVPVNDAPVAQSDAWTLPANSFVEDRLRASDVDGDSLTYTITAQPTKGTLDASALPQIRYTATPSSDPDYQATDFFEFRTNDGQVSSNVARISISIIKSNNTRPVSLARSFQLLEDTVFTGFLTATDADGDALTYSLVRAPNKGAVTVTNAATGEFSYTPQANYNGADSFEFRVKDQFYFSSAATVSLTVIPVNDAPTVSPLARTTLEDTPVTVTLQGQDIDGDSLTFSITSAGSLGDATIAGSTLTYTPKKDRNGVDTLRYVAFDGVAFSAAATITITITPVNDPPVAQDSTFTFNEDTVLSRQFLATDVDSPQLTFAADPNTRDYLGTLAVSPSGAFTYTPPQDYYGTQIIRFQVSDGEFVRIGTVTLIILPVADRPVATPMQVELDEDSSLLITLQGTDVDGDQLTFQVQGSVQVQGATLTTVNATTVRYTPPPNYFGPDSFSFLANDGQLPSANPATVSITVRPVNDPPVAFSAVYNVLVGKSLVVTVRAEDVDSPMADLSLSLVNSTGPRGSASLVISPPRSFVFTAAPGATAGWEAIEVEISDGQATSRATISFFVAVAQTPPPRVIDLTLYGQEDKDLRDNLATAVISKKAPLQRFILSDLPAVSAGQVLAMDGSALSGGRLDDAAGAFLFRPAADFNGQVTFRFTAVDSNNGISNEGTVRLIINPVNDAPVALQDAFSVDEDTTLTVALRATDIDSTYLAFSLQGTQGLAAHSLVLATNGLLTFTPRADFSGTVTFTFTVEDDQQARSAPATVTITVRPVNDAPVAGDFAFTGVEDTELTGQVSATDIDSASLTFSALTQPARGTLELSEDGTFTYTPELNQNEEVSFFYRASDGELADQGRVTISITPVNDLPVAQDLAVTVDEDSEICSQLSASDVEDASLQFFADDSAAPKNAAQFYVAMDGSFCYTPKANYHGSDSFRFYAMDSEGGISASATVSVEVLSVPDLPVANNLWISIDEDTSFEGTLTATDADGDALTFALSRAPAYGTLTLAADGATSGRFTYTPAADFNGVDLAWFSVSDGQSEITGTIFIKVAPVNDPPTAGDLELSATYQQPAAGRFAGSDIDAADVLTYEVVDKPAWGSVAISGNGEFVYFFNVDSFASNDTFTYRAFDGKARSEPATVRIALTREFDGRENIAGDSKSPANIGLAAGLGSLAAIAAVVIAFVAYKKFMAFKEAQAHISNLKAQDEFQNNPLYETLSQEVFNPLYENRGPVAQHYAPNEL